MSFITHILFFLAGLGVAYYISKRMFERDMEQVEAARDLLNEYRKNEVQQERPQPISQKPIIPNKPWPIPQKKSLQETPMRKVLTNAETPRIEHLRTEVTYNMDKLDENARAMQEHLKTHKMVG